MAVSARSQRLELTWYNKDKALIPTELGRYGYAWVDPRDPRYCEVRTLVSGARIDGVRKVEEDGVTYSDRAELEPTTDNLLIQGESGDVLEALRFVPEFADKYRGKVKCCYIDPPFNTEKTFEHYEDNLEHSIWLTMMRDRLLHIRALLSADGSIWVHLDDTENHRMRCLLDEVFGAGNFVSEVVWEKSYSPRNDAKGVSASTDTILVYQMSEAWAPNRLERRVFSNKRFASRDGDPDPWYDGDAAAPGAATHQGMVYAIQNPVSGKWVYPSQGRCWALGQDTLLKIMREWAPYELRDLNDKAQRAEVAGIPWTEVRQGVMAIALSVPLEEAKKIASARYEAGNWPEFYLTGKGGSGGIRRKKRSGALQEGRTPTNLWKWDEVGHNDSAKKEIRSLFPGEHPFSTPKPERLLERIIHIATNPGDIILDVFAGSGTTAAVAHKMGRRWVTCELLDDTVQRFTLPRLTAVVVGEDQGGITVTAGHRLPAEDIDLPDGVSAEDAQKFTSLLNKVVKGHDELTKSDAVKGLKALTKTRNSGDVVNWLGGGSFTKMRLSPAIFDFDPQLGLVTLADTAHGETLIASVAANLGFARTQEDQPFHGRLGDMYLLVVDGAVSEPTVEDAVAILKDGERLTIAATGVPDGIRARLRSLSRGSRVLHIPDDLFPFTGAAEVEEVEP